MSHVPLMPAKFARFERVRIDADHPQLKEYNGAIGTIVWCDPCYRVQSPDAPWAYVVRIPSQECYPAFLQSHLQSLNSFDAESSHLGLKPEISFDFVLADDMDGQFMEGTYRLPGKFWEVFIFVKEPVHVLKCRPSTWESGIKGIRFDVPATHSLNRDYMLKALSDALGIKSWNQVHGPDSIFLR